MRDKKVLRIVMCAMFAALACVATLVIQIPSPMNGYVNLGDCIVLLGAFLLGPVYGAAAGAVGSALADLISGYAHYVPGTFVIKGVMALVAGIIFIKMKNKNVSSVLGAIAAEVIMVLGYFAYAGMLLGKGLATAASIPGNLVQGLIGIIVSVVVYMILDKSGALKRINSENKK